MTVVPVNKGLIEDDMFLDLLLESAGRVATCLWLRGRVWSWVRWIARDVCCVDVKQRRERLTAATGVASTNAVSYIAPWRSRDASAESESTAGLPLHRGCTGPGDVVLRARGSAAARMWRPCLQFSSFALVWLLERGPQPISGMSPSSRPCGQLPERMGQASVLLKGAVPFEGQSRPVCGES